MTRRFLIGPVSNHWAKPQLPDRIRSERCRTLGWSEASDVSLIGCDSWPQLMEKLPAGEWPEFVLTLAGHTTIPNWLWTAPVPIIALAIDPESHWHHQRACLPSCDHVFAHRAYRKVFARQGISHVGELPCFGIDVPSADEPPTSSARDIDLLLVGSLSPFLDQKRLKWLRPLARLGRQWNVVLHRPEDPGSLRPLLGRTKILVDVAGRDAWQSLALEGMAAQALVFVDEENRDLPVEFSGGTDAVFCCPDNLEGLADNYLHNEDARAAKARHGSAGLGGFTKEAIWDRLLQNIEQAWPGLVERAARRNGSPLVPSFQARLAHLLAEGGAAEPNLVRDLAAWSAEHPNDADAHNTLGVAIAFLARGDGPVTIEIARTAQEQFRRALQANPLHHLARLNLVEVLAGLSQTREAIQEARASLQRLAGQTQLDPDLLDAAIFPPEASWFRLGWEQAACDHAGRPVQEARAKWDLLRWRLHFLLAELTGELPHYYEAELAWPGVPGCLAALGSRLGREGRAHEAVIHLEKAVEAAPLDLAAARVLSHAYGEVGNYAAQRRLQRETALLHRLGLLPAEAWYLGTSVEETERPTLAVQPGAPRVPSATAISSCIVSSISAAPAIAPGVSLCMIVRNEESNIAACLESVRDLMDEIVVVDTGSTDATKSIAARLGAKVFDFPWIDSFAAARNESLRHATREWLFWMDADDRLDEENRGKLRALCSQLPQANVAYVMKCLCLPDMQSGTATVVDHVRLFRNDARIRWKYRVHEQILMAVRESGAEVRWSDVIVHHTGYQDPQHRLPKLQRYLRLLQLDNSEHRHDPFTLFNLGWTLSELGKPAEALPYLQESRALSDSQDSIVRKVYVLMSGCHAQLGQSQQALQVCREGLWTCPNDPALLFQEAMLLTDQNNLAAAEACLIQLLNVRDGPYFASVDPALRGYKAHHQLGVIYHRQRRGAEARSSWQAALAERHDFVPALMGLLELALEAKVWPEFTALLRRLEALPNSQLEVEVLRARAHLARNEYHDARELLESTKQRHPQALWPRVVLSHVLLQEHRDLDAAEIALRDVLVLAPDHLQSQNNLQVLLEEKKARENGRESS
jgi:tetratricopeptide (TPR) repeat protein